MDSLYSVSMIISQPEIPYNPDHNKLWRNNVVADSIEASYANAMTILQTTEPNPLILMRCSVLKAENVI